MSDILTGTMLGGKKTHKRLVLWLVFKSKVLVDTCTVSVSSLDFSGSFSFFRTYALTDLYTNFCLVLQKFQYGFV